MYCIKLEVLELLSALCFGERSHVMDVSVFGQDLGRWGGSEFIEGHVLGVEKSVSALLCRAAMIRRCVF